MELPVKRFKRAEVQDVISNLNPKKSSGYDVITDKILKELPVVGIKYLAQSFSCSSQMILLGAMESSTCHPHPEARKS
jgi:hypothetical protein